VRGFQIDSTTITPRKLAAICGSNENAALPGHAASFYLGA
jgi:hypothetical protein